MKAPDIQDAKEGDTFTATLKLKVATSDTAVTESGVIVGIGKAALWMRDADVLDYVKAPVRDEFVQRTMRVLRGKEIVEYGDVEESNNGEYFSLDGPCWTQGLTVDEVKERNRNIKRILRPIK